MSSHRPYRPALGLDAAVDEITKEKGIRYDPAVVDACIALIQEHGENVFREVISQSSER